MNTNEGDEWHWQWLGDGTTDERENGRTHYSSVGSLRRSDNFMRIYKVGDPVIISGEEEEDSWIAQIVDLFCVNDKDAELRDLLLTDRRRRGMRQNSSYELMRVTLRWFYNQGDMNKQTLRRSSAPMPVKNEVYFSDHVEKDGYNDVQVIEGMAWLFPSKASEASFLSNPDMRYMKSKDRTRIVRCFVNSTASDLPVRELESNELSYLLKHPNTDKDLFSNSRMRMYNSSGAVLKGTRRKRKRASSSRRSINPDELEADDNSEPDSKRFRDEEDKEEWKLEDFADVVHPQSPNKTIHRRRKVVIPDDDDSSSPKHDMTPPKKSLPAKSPKSLSGGKRKPGVHSMAVDSNENEDSSLQADEMYVDSDEITPVEMPGRSGKKGGSKKAKGGGRNISTSKKSTQKVVVSETINLDGSDDEVLEKVKQKAQQLQAAKMKSTESSVTRKTSGGDKGHPSAKQRNRRSSSPVGNAGGMGGSKNGAVVKGGSFVELDNVLKKLKEEFQKVPSEMQTVLVSKLNMILANVFIKVESVGVIEMDDEQINGLVARIIEELSMEMTLGREFEQKAAGAAGGGLESV